LIGFRAYPEPKLWLKKRTLGKNQVPQKATLAVWQKAITRQPIELEQGWAITLA